MLLRRLSGWGWCGAGFVVAELIEVVVPTAGAVGVVGVEVVREGEGSGSGEEGEGGGLLPKHIFGGEGVRMGWR